jgi:SARP family transcriptional regulator, regulator of embCAB operon
LATTPVRLYLTGHLAVQGPAGVVDAARLPGRQGVRAVCALGLAGTTPLRREQLAAALWDDDEAPPSWDNALSAVVSKVRAAFGAIGLDPTEVLPLVGGCYQRRLPPGSWSDVEVARNRLDRAEGALRVGDADTAWSEATVATSILRRPLLPGEDGDWLRGARADLCDAHLRALLVVAAAWCAKGHGELAVAAAREAVTLAPFRESAHRALMRAHLVAGDRAEAVRAYEHLRGVLRDELGIDPSRETEAVYLEVLRDG